MSLVLAQHEKKAKTKNWSAEFYMRYMNENEKPNVRQSILTAEACSVQFTRRRNRRYKFQLRVENEIDPEEMLRIFV